MSYRLTEDAFFDEPSIKKAVSKMSTDELRREQNELALDFDFSEAVQTRIDEIERELSKRKLF